jgi:hypothetical protein
MPRSPIRQASTELPTGRDVCLVRPTCTQAAIAGQVPTVRRNGFGANGKSKVTLGCQARGAPDPTSTPAVRGCHGAWPSSSRRLPIGGDHFRDEPVGALSAILDRRTLQIQSGRIAIGAGKAVPHIRLLPGIPVDNPIAMGGAGDLHNLTGAQ